MRMNCAHARMQDSSRGSQQSTPRGGRAKSPQLSKDERRIKAKEADEKQKLEKAYKLFSPPELFKGREPSPRQNGG